MKIFKSIWNFISSKTLWISLAVIAALFSLFAIVNFMALDLYIKMIDLTTRYPLALPDFKPYMDPFKNSL